MSAEPINITTGLVDDDYDMSWQAYAACARTDPEAFFPEKGGTTAAAKRVCAGCPVRPECLDYAVATKQQHGVWGGESYRQRRKLAKAQEQQDAA